MFWEEISEGRNSAVWYIRLGVEDVDGGEGGYKQVVEEDKLVFDRDKEDGMGF